MQITNARWADAEHTAILCDIEGISSRVPASGDNRHFTSIVMQALPIAEFAPPLTPDDVRAEASRRMCAMVGARDAEHLAVIISNGMREAVELLRVKGDRPWTLAEEQRDAQLRAFSKAIDAIRSASNVLEAADVIPSDYADDKYWPVIGG